MRIVPSAVLRVAACLCVPFAACDQTTEKPTEPIAGPTPALGSGKIADTAGRYIVVLKPSPTAATTSAALEQQYARRTLFTYRHALVGFAADLDADALSALRKHPDVAYVQPDQEGEDAGTDYNAGWGVGRIDQRYGPSDNVFSYLATGAGVNIYAVGTGIKATHADFGGRVVGAYSFNPSSYPAGDDCNGHGTQVASVAAGNEYGVAKGATLRDVRVQDCQANASLSQYCAGVDWVAGNHLKPAVMVMSRVYSGPLGIPNVLRDAAIGAKNAGVFVVAAAGNNGGDACGYAPANAMPIMTVAATDQNDARGIWGSEASNYGACVDLFAPGTSLNVALHTGGYGTASGTSVASPVVAGVAAILLEQYPNDSPDQIHYAIRDGATSGVVSNPGPSSPNLLVYSTLPVPVYTNIIGPSLVGPFMNGTWIADPRGGRGPFQYTWFGVLAGTSNNVSGQVPHPGWLNLEVRGALGGYAATSKYIDVDPSNQSIWCS